MFTSFSTVNFSIRNSEYTQSFQNATHPKLEVGFKPCTCPILRGNQPPTCISFLEFLSASLGTWDLLQFHCFCVGLIFEQGHHKK